MTIAVCIRCGEIKFGAWRPCPNCGFQPEAPLDKAKSLLVTDHYFPEDYLEQVSSELKRGLPLDFDDEDAAPLAKEIEAQDYFFSNLDCETDTIPCMKCGRRFKVDIEKEEVICPLCSAREEA